jgi:L-lactate utilization protein LutB
VKYYTSSTTETNAGRFLRSKTNALKEISTYQWDETNGNLISETDEENAIIFPSA